MSQQHSREISAILETDIIELQTHPIYNSLNSLNDLRTFMSCHVFVVWDFMSLLKSLQLSLTNVSVPWLPPRDAFSARLINEIVLEEESDIDPKGNASSHLELYISAMSEVGASTKNFHIFLDKLREGDNLKDALVEAEVPKFVANFVSFSVDTALDRNLCEVAAAFVFGREAVIPLMFKNLINNWKISEESAQAMHYYVKRHIQIDGDQHGPASLKLLENLIESQPDKLEQVIDYGRQAIRERIKLWDGLNMLIRSNSATKDGIAA